MIAGVPVTATMVKSGLRSERRIKPPDQLFDLVSARVMHEAEAQDAGLRIAAKRTDGAHGIEITGTGHHPVRREVGGNGSRTAHE